MLKIMIYFALLEDIFNTRNSLMRQMFKIQWVQQITASSIYRLTHYCVQQFTVSSKTLSLHF